MTLLDDFASAARSYCNWAEQADGQQSAKSEMQAARRYLAALYAIAVGLPSYECEWVERPVSKDEWAEKYARFGALPVGYYGSICNPLQVPAGEAALGDLADDLADIWRDLQQGLTIFEDGYRNAAGWQWQDSFSHWGEHALNALAIIHLWLTQIRYRE